MASILVKKNIITRNGCCGGWKDVKVKVIGRRSRCKSNWCPLCGKRSVKRFAGKLSELDWRSVRQTVLTIDRAKFTGPKDAYEYVSGGKKLSEYVKALRRSGIDVRGYAWALEWHADGFPHWHVFIDVGKSGRRGMIGNELLLRAWSIGAVRESYFKDERHFKKLTDYFDKNGYFERKKGHQSILPGWALRERSIIRRCGGSEYRGEVEKGGSIARDDLEVKDFTWRESGEGQDYFTRIMWGVAKGERRVAGQAVSNREVLESCGQYTEICLMMGGRRGITFKDKNGFDHIVEPEVSLMNVGRSRVSYKDFKGFKGEYLPRLGYCVEMGAAQWQRFYEGTVLGGEV